MSSIRLEQENKSTASKKPDGAKGESAPGIAIDSQYPSARYFQVHFQHLYEMLEILREQLREANRQIASQNEILQNGVNPSEIRTPQAPGTPELSTIAPHSRPADRSIDAKGRQNRS